ncbi:MULTISPECIES: TatD family hydrolase [unclassified Enterococcus]|uniref:TatD family hydrolase n=1 Tax=unclassified Enterococcus TaxID=2608891 RepID=UPI001555F48A|nr:MULTISPECIES: TatD family hydrolase [unclassified Enterococcus]MBS7576282.1 TatD family hydrolase [Enterococcus sp. MMGLQ5-2]MBS7583515.1 TatD family hydrolase [Enterococcus sp. MMGLQ5-1]NPD11377.1 TatD family hydrolase [Enterococcus sp. MMGLQ5-1]NPD36120.1 TatD family hydrolase [Enterococcus sp. MMGLQ5-2]
MLFDTHTHLNVEQFAGIEAEKIENAKALEVTEMAIVGFDQATIEKSLALSERFTNLYSIIGWHPTEAGSYSEAVETYLIRHLKDQKVVALGEIGLDYHWMTASEQIQEQVFRRQIQLAKQFDLPIVIHTRDAIEDTYRILKSEGLPKAGGIMHSFSGDIEAAQKFLDLDMYLSFSGVVTFKNAPELREVAKMVPLNRILVETDAPYLAPMPYRGKQNEPAYTYYTAKRIAEERAMNFELFAKQTTENAHRIFKIENDS